MRRGRDLLRGLRHISVLMVSTEALHDGGDATGPGHLPRLPRRADEERDKGQGTGGHSQQGEVADQHCNAAEPSCFLAGGDWKRPFFCYVLALIGPSKLGQ